MTADPRHALAGLRDPASEIACTLDGGDVDSRLDEWRAVVTLARSREPIDGGLRLAFDQIDIRALTDLAIREHDCCAFLSFAIGIATGGTTLEITGPPNAGDVIESLADLARGIG